MFYEPLRRISVVHLVKVVFPSTAFFKNVQSGRLSYTVVLADTNSKSSNCLHVITNVNTSYWL